MTNIPSFRIRKISLNNFRNIKFGEVELPNGDMESYLDAKPSVLGLYGQNGSGKTSLLMALDILRTVLIGEGLDYKHYISAIREGCEECKLSFEFVGYTASGITFEVWYDFCIKKAIRDTSITKDTFANSIIDDDFNGRDEEEAISIEEELNNDLNDDYSEKIIVTDERLQYAAISPEGEIQRKQILIDTSDEACAKSKRAFGNKAKYDMFTEGAPEDMNVHEWFTKWRTITEERSSSFIFSKSVLNNLLAGCKHRSHRIVLRGLSFFAATSLFIIGSEETGLNNMKELPLMIRIENKKGIQIMMAALSLDKTAVPESVFNNTIESIESLNTVLDKLIPGLNLRCIDNGKYTNKKGKEVHRFDLLSDRNGVRIPFEYESDGIRRIVSFLSMLIAVYNNPSVTLAVDEIDSGIFEYLLGEIISVMGKNARGQLIFTSHNLRPLEVLPPKYLIFTSVNPEKRFVKLDGISGNNNLRDCYFRSIVLGGGKETIYEATDTYDIEQALFSAGYHGEYDNSESTDSEDSDS